MTAPRKYQIEAVRLANIERGDHVLRLPDVEHSPTLRALARVLYEHDLPVHDPEEDEAAKLWDETKGKGVTSFCLLGEADQHHVIAFYRRIREDRIEPEPAKDDGPTAA